MTLDDWTWWIQVFSPPPFLTPLMIWSPSQCRLSLDGLPVFLFAGLDEDESKMDVTCWYGKAIRHMHRTTARTHELRRAWNIHGCVALVKRQIPTKVKARSVADQSFKTRGRNVEGAQEKEKWCAITFFKNIFIDFRKKNSDVCVYNCTSFVTKNLCGRIFFKKHFYVQYVVCISTAAQNQA